MPWWYSVRGKKKGPIALDEFKTLLSTKQVDSATLVWHEGMEAWKKLGELDEFHQLTSTTPPPLPQAPLAGPWTRYFSRQFDCIFEVTLLILVYKIQPYKLPDDILASTSVSESLLIVLLLPLALVVDSVFFFLFGNTIGKALLGIQVQYENGGELPFLVHLTRNLNIWLYGLGLGLPLIGLIPLLYQYNRVKNGELASYDTNDSIVVRAHSPSILQKAIFTGVTIFVLLSAAVLGTLGNNKQKIYSRKTEIEKRTTYQLPEKAKLNVKEAKPEPIRIESPYRQYMRATRPKQSE